MIHGDRRSFQRWKETKPIISLKLWDEDFDIWLAYLTKMGVTQVALYANKGAIDHTFEAPLYRQFYFSSSMPTWCNDISTAMEGQ
jgi:hypothetical protein